MTISLQVIGLDRVRTQLSRLSLVQVNQAAAAAINDTAHLAQRAIKTEFVRVFNRVTPYMLRSVRVGAATPGALVATIAPEYMGGKGVDPQKVLAAQVAGGARRDKRSEVALRRAGILPGGYQTSIPDIPYPGSDDGRGNLRGAFLVRLLSYFQSFSEVGYRANITAKRKNKLASVGRSAGGYKTIGGVIFFVGTRGLRDGPGRNFAPGIWAKSGIHGVRAQPVLMFVRSGIYTSRLTLDSVIKSIDLQAKFETRLRYRIRQLSEAIQ